MKSLKRRTNLARKRRTKIKKYRRRRTRSSRIKRGGNDVNECGVCLEEKELCSMKPCNHKICNDCFTKLTTKTCPFCRANVTQLDCNGIVTEVETQQPLRQQRQQRQRRPRITRDQYTTVNRIITNYLGENWERYDDGPNSYVSFRYLGSERTPPNFNIREIQNLIEPYNVTMEAKIVGGVGFLLGLIDNYYY